MTELPGAVPIVMCEPQCWGAEHAAVNAPLVETALAAFPQSPFYFFGEAEHLRLLRQNLKPADEARIEWHEVELLPRQMRRVIPRTIREVPWWREMLARARELNCNRIIACSCPPAGVLALKLLLRRPPANLRVFLIQHGSFNDMVRRRRNPFRRVLSMKRILCLLPTPALRYIVLSESIRDEALRMLPQIEPYLRWMPHAYRFAPATQRRLQPGRPLRFGFLGGATTAKGFDWFVRLAHEMEARHPGGAQFHLIGALPGRLPDDRPLPASITVHGGHGMLERADYDRLANEMDYAMVLHDPNAYRLASNATILDAFSYGLPVIGRRTAANEDYFAKLGDIGYLVDDVEALCACVAQLVNEPPYERYTAQSADIIAGREMLAPGAAAPRLREIVEEL